MESTGGAVARGEKEINWQSGRAPDDTHWTIARCVDRVGYGAAIYIQPASVGLRQAVKAVDWEEEAQ
jgi:hypothetical protein